MMFICPVCCRPLEKAGSSLICASGHSYDISKHGYVNLLRSNASGKRHGDDKLMVRARRDFLATGIYDPLSREVCRLSEKYTPANPVILDAGCGEGKYTLDIYNYLTSAGKKCTICGIDISKDAVDYAARLSSDIQFAAASSAAIPMADESTDLVISIFSPLMAGEFLRVLKSRGVFIRAYPLERHLIELKELIYDRPYENPPEDLTIDGFKLVETCPVKYAANLRSNEEIMNLFKMTPYYYKTSAADQARAAATRSLDVSLEFGVSVYKKEFYN